MDIKVLYEDNHLIAVFKPAGILSQSDKTGDISMLDIVRNYLKETYKKQGNVYVGLLHRLDRPVSGIMLFAKTSKGASRLSEQFRNHEVEKTYNAVVIGRPKENRGILTNYLRKIQSTKSQIRNKFKAQNSKSKKSGFKEANLYYETLKTNDKYSLLKIKIETGRFHQIRAQLSMAGLPILGDVKYGAPEPLSDKSIALCATDLFFYTATNEKLVKISVKMPENWKKFV